ncbi:uncharacterized protein LOC135644173 [Musa acuminata AAA Group]|uniref:uncharacterized protein LOC135644173 n=1 Tax=Musa acuminata AAA Group TaxID=214697 RepID=UPI0031D1F295
MGNSSGLGQPLGRAQLSQVNQCLDAFQQELWRLHSEPNEGASSGSPFTQEVQDKPVPLNFRFLTLEMYDGGSDPMEHVSTWFSRLRQALVSSFDQLAEEFKQSFLASARPRPSMATLLALSQREDESLSQFVSLIEKSPATISEMLQCANQYVAAEALVAGRRMEGKKPRMELSRGTTSVVPMPPRRGPNRQDLLLPRPPPLLLNASCTEIFLQIKESGLLQQPRPMKAACRDQSKYCRFHRDHGHDTEDCHDLWNQIEALIWRGHLGRYLKSREAIPCPRGPPERQIDVISSGPAAGGTSTVARKAYARSAVEKCPWLEHEPTITFGAGEVERSHHDDALVISVQIANA